MTQDTEKRTCPACGHENEPSAVACAQCGTPLMPSTFPVSNVTLQRIGTEDAVKPKPKPRVSAGGVALWVRSDPTPVLIEPDEGVILGRETEGQKDPPSLINLARYDAYRLGVSRRHAQIECKSDSCLLLDLGSSNGTWINGLKLRPYQPAVLKTGDRVNLARLEFIVGPLTDEARARAGLPTLQLLNDAEADDSDDADSGQPEPGTSSIAPENLAADTEAPGTGKSASGTLVDKREDKPAEADEPERATQPKPPTNLAADTEAPGTGKSASGTLVDKREDKSAEADEPERATQPEPPTNLAADTASTGADKAASDTSVDKREDEPTESSDGKPKPNGNGS